MRTAGGRTVPFRPSGRLLAILFISTGFVPRLIVGEERSSPTFFEDVMPILRARCSGCHGGDRPKGRLSVATLEELLAGGKRGAPLKPGDPGGSLLYQLITGQKKPIMPPEREGPLGSAEIEAIRKWIEAGCPPGRAAVEAAPYSAPLAPPLYSRPPPVKALTYSRGGGHLYVAGYREVLVHRTGSPGGAPAARLAGEAEEITLLQLSPDGRTLLALGGSPGRFGEAQLWDLAEARLLRFHRIGKDTLFAGAFSPAGDRLVLAGSDRLLHVHDAASGKELCAPEVHSDWVLGAALIPDGSRVISGGRDRTVKVSAVPQGELLQTLATLDGPVMRLVARPGTTQALVGGESRKPILYDAGELKQVRDLEAQPGAILALAASADGKLLAVGGVSSEVRVYEAETGKRKAALQAPGGWIYALAFHPDSQRLAAGGHDGQVRVFDLAEGKELRAFVPVPIGRQREL